MHEQSFLIQAVVFLAAAVVFVPLAKKLGLGSVLGYLIAGIVIGPYVIGFIENQGEDIMHYAEFGVVMMLFLIGLELEPELLWKLRKNILGLGSMQVVLTTAIFFGIVLLTGMPWQQSLALGMVISMSSTAIVMQSLRENGWMKTIAGQSAFSVLLFQDIAVIPMLALFPLLSNLPLQKASGPQAHTWVDGQPGWVHTVVFLLTIAAIIVVGRLLIRPLLRIVAKSGQREVFTATSLLIVAGIAALMAQVGLSPALGAFLAGVVLANSEYRHELESDLEPFKGLLLGLFFIAVGAGIDFKLIAANPWKITLWVAGVMLLKTGILALLGKSFKMSTEQNSIFSFSLAQVGEFAFVLLSFTLQEGILPSATVSFFTAVAAISMGLTPLLGLFNEKVILPRVGTNEADERAADDIDEKNPVIIAGFGHFGNTIGRFLRANKINATYLDIDSDRVDVLRRMGFKVFYGDASRYDLLQSAGAAEAKILVVAIDDEEKRLQMIDTVKKHFPNLHIFTRATNRNDAYKLMNAGMLHIYRETIDTSLRLGVDVMTMLGFRTYTAKRLAKTFMRHDEDNLKKLATIRSDEEYISKVREYIEEIEAIVQEDAKGPSLMNTGWDAEALREEIREMREQ